MPEDLRRMVTVDRLAVGFMLACAAALILQVRIFLHVLSQSYATVRDAMRRMNFATVARHLDARGQRALTQFKRAALLLVVATALGALLLYVTAPASSGAS